MNQGHLEITAANTADDPSLAHLLGRLSIVAGRVQAAVVRRRMVDSEPDALRGLYISESKVDELLGELRSDGTPDQADPGLAQALADVEAAAEAAEEVGAPIRLRRLARAFGLEPLDIELLVIALSPDLDARFERLFGYLHDDVTRRRASVGLALDLAGVAPADVAGRRSLTPGAPLIDGGLILVEDSERPFLTRSLRVPDRVVLHLLGDNRPDPGVGRLLAPPGPRPVGNVTALARAFGSAPLFYVRDRPEGNARTLAAAALAEAGVPLVSVDLRRLPVDDAAEALAAVVREARLRDAGLVAGPVDGLAERDARLIGLLAESGWLTILFGASGWDQSWARSVPLIIESGEATPAERESLWRAGMGDDVDVELGHVSAQFRLGPEQVARAAVAARMFAAYEGRPVTLDDLQAGARSQNSVALERLARRVVPAARWDDLVLPPGALGALRDLAIRARQRYRVLDEWGLRRGGARGEGITALFVGESGTGKTTAAEIVAHDLGLELYAINLATVVDKYVGETEKNLERIFDGAEGVNGVLFFDEADALFGKRSDVSDAKDRYANVEVAYLLQKMEQFDGVAILATNLRGNVDEAFTRRLASIVEFPVPDAARRRELWERCLGTKVPRADDVDLDFCARQFELTGGHIRNICVTAAFLAAEAEQPIDMTTLIRATHREYLKLGRLVLREEFGPYYELNRA